MKTTLLLAVLTAFSLNVSAQQTPEDREAALRRIKLEQDAQKETAEAKQAEKAAAEAARARKAADAEAKRVAAVEKQKQEALKRKQMEERCVIKPVMTNDDIEACRVLAR